MHAGMNEWGRRLAALADFNPPADGWAAVLAARRQREPHLTLRWPAALAAAVLAAALGLGWWLQSAQSELANPELPARTAYALASDVILAERAVLAVAVAVGASGVRVAQNETETHELQAKVSQQGQQIAKSEQAVEQLPEIRQDIKELLRRVK